MAVCPLATQLSSCARASSARPRTRTRTATRTATTHRRARDRRRDATRVDVATDAIIDVIARSSSPFVSMRRRVAPRSSRRRRSERTNERTNERTRARSVFARSARLSRPVDGRRRRLRTETHPAADVSSVYICTLYTHTNYIRIDRRQTEFVNHGITHRPSTIPRDHTHRETRPDSSSSRVGRRSASRVDARVAPHGSSRLMIGRLSCPSPIDES